MTASGDRQSRAGFVLAGGRSSRMGRDKALLPLDGHTLVDHIAGLVQRAAGNVTLIGPPERYATLGYPVIPDLIDNAARSAASTRRFRPRKPTGI